MCQYEPSAMAGEHCIMANNSIVCSPDDGKLIRNLLTIISHGSRAHKNSVRREYGYQFEGSTGPSNLPSSKLFQEQGPTQPLIRFQAGVL